DTERGGEVTEHADAHDVGAKGAHGGEEHGENPLDDDEDPKVPQLTMGAKASAYVSIAIMALACIYSWVLLFASAFSSTLPEQGITVLSYPWLVQPGAASYVVAFHLDRLAIAMMVVVTTVSLMVQFYSQGYMKNSA